MRPVNLIPAEQRQGTAPALRAGPTAYLLVAVLLIGLVAVTATVLASNSIAEKEAEVASLEQREADATARAEALAPYAEFAALAAAREETVRSLARSRFDWERVLNELALVVPESVWLTEMSGTVSPDAQVGAAGAVGSRAQIPGPALSLSGCATSQDEVAGFLASLRDIDGVTRVGLESSERGTESETSGGSGTGSTPSASGEGASCQTRAFIVQFEIVAAFDEVAVPATSATPAPVPGGEAPTAPGATPSAEEQATAAPETEEAAASTAAQTQGAEQAATAIGVAR